MASIEEIKPYSDDTSTKKQQVEDMFDNISGTYDFLNHFMSLGIDILWRKRAVRLLKRSNPQQILDVATGTGDFALEAIRQLKPSKITGIDLSEGMLAIARKKIAKLGLSEQFEVVRGDSEALPFETSSFDAVTVAFGARNFENLDRGLSEMYRVTRPGGQVVILEFSQPRGFLVRGLYHFYFSKITPHIGRLFSKDKRAYTYLPESVASFPSGRDFTNLLEKIGFRQAVGRPQLFGICTIYTGVK